MLDLLVAEFACYEEKSRFQDTHCCGRRNSVEVFQLNLGHHIIIRLQGDLEDITLLCL